MKINQRFKKTISFGMLLLISTCASAERMTISDTQIPYFAMLKGSSSRYLLVSNPKLCAQAPGPCRFFIESSYGHLHLNHLLLPPKAYTQHDLQQADCFAVYNVSAQDNYETVRLLQNPDQAAKYAVQGDLAARAENIQACANKAGKWITSKE